jgi:uncharacterized iron-regulated membrane protein
MVIEAPRARAAAPTTPPRTKAARVWWLVHQWAGLKLSILLSFVLVTGTLAVFGNEIDWLMRPAMRVSAAGVRGPVDWAAIARTLAVEAQGGRVLSIDAPIDRGFAAIATVIKADGRRAFLYLHPSTGALQGEGDWVGAQRILRNMHRHLNLPTPIGVPIVSALSLLLLVSVATSLVVYKKWWRGFFRPLRWRDARTAWGDAHRLCGVWCLWFAALIGTTGLWYLAESTVARAPRLPSVAVVPAALDGAALAAGLERGLAAARVAAPDLRIERVIFPSERSGAFQFQGQRAAVLVRARANSVWTDARGGGALLATNARTLDAHQRISEMADPLHFGTVGGVWTKLIWFVFGAMLTTLSVSGVAIYALRLSPPHGAWARGWRGMGSWRWLALSGIVTALALLPALMAAQGGD